MRIRTVLLAPSATRHELFVVTNSACKREDCVPWRDCQDAPRPELLRRKKSPRETGPSSASRPKKGAIDGLRPGLVSAKQPSARLSVGWVCPLAPTQVLSLSPPSGTLWLPRDTRPAIPQHEISYHSS